MPKEIWNNIKDQVIINNEENKYWMEHSRSKKYKHVTRKLKQGTEDDDTERIPEVLK